MRSEGKSQKQSVAIALRKAGVKKKNPTGSMWKNPLLWVGGGALAAFVGFRVWSASKAAPPPSASVTVTLPPSPTFPTAPAGSPAASMTPAQINDALAPYAANPFEFASHYQQLYTPV